MIFLLIYMNLLYVFRATNSPIFRSTFDCIYRFGTMHRYCCQPVQCTKEFNLVTGRQHYRCIVLNQGTQPCHRSAAISARCTKAVYTVKKCSWRWASLSPETCRAGSNISIKISINENRCMLLVDYIVVLTMHGLTNIKSKFWSVSELGKI